VKILAAFQDSAKGIYPLGKCPKDGQWNGALPWDKNESFLRQGKSEKPIVLWLVAEITDRFLYSPSGNEPNKINISVKPLDSRIRPYCVKLLHGLADPPDSSGSLLFVATFRRLVMCYSVVLILGR
jgi:hypothetical protein